METTSVQLRPGLLYTLPMLHVLVHQHHYEQHADEEQRIRERARAEKYNTKIRYMRYNNHSNIPILV